MASLSTDQQNELLACARGDQRAFQRLYDHEASRMLALALQMVGQRGLAEELLVESFVLIWKNAESFDPGRSSARAWLYSILRYRALGRLRQNPQGPSGASVLGLFPSASVLAAAANRGQGDPFLRGLSQLDEKSRQGVYLAFYKGFDYPRMARTLECTVEEAQDRLRDALYLLQQNDRDDARSISPDDSVLLAEYTLGLLDPAAVARVHEQLGEDDHAVLEALQWEARFLRLTDLLAVIPPSAGIFYKVQARLGHDSVPPPSSLFRQAASAPDLAGGMASTAAAPPATASSPVMASSPATGTVPAPSVAAGAPSASSGVSANSLPATGGEPPAATGRLRQTSAVDAPQRRGISAGETVVADPEPPVESAADASEPDPPPATPDTDPGPAPYVASHRGLRFWRIVAVASVLLAATALGLYATRPPPPAPVTIIQVAPTLAAILLAPGTSSTPAWVVTQDHNKNVLFKPLVNSVVPAGETVVLWTQAPGEPAPRSLGVIDPNLPFVIPAQRFGKVVADQIIEITQEPATDPNPGAPDGPVLFIGRFVTFGELEPSNVPFNPPSR